MPLVKVVERFVLIDAFDGERWNKPNKEGRQFRFDLPVGDARVVHGFRVDADFSDIRLRALVQNQLYISFDVEDHPLFRGPAMTFMQDVNRQYVLLQPGHFVADCDDECGQHYLERSYHDAMFAQRGEPTPDDACTRSRTTTRCVVDKTELVGESVVGYPTHPIIDGLLFKPIPVPSGFHACVSLMLFDCGETSLFNLLDEPTGRRYISIGVISSVAE